MLELRPQQLGRCAAVSRDWQRAAMSDLVWRPLLDALCSAVYVPTSLRQRLATLAPACELYLAVVKDCARVEISLAELTELDWRFRFKESAGPGWVSRDPYWNDQPAIRVSFSEDGQVSMTGGEGNEFFNEVDITWRWGNAEGMGAGTFCDAV